MTRTLETAEKRITVRLAKEKDYQRILDILNAAILERRVTALLTPVTIYVAEKDGIVAGWMAVTAYRCGREGFKHACEISYYIAPEFRGSGIGSSLMEHVICESRKRGLKNLMAVIFADNLGSQRLAFKYGFKIWGTFPEIVEIDGRTTDCYQMGLKL